MELILLVSWMINFAFVSSQFPKKLQAEEYGRIRKFLLGGSRVLSEDHEVVPIVHNFEYNSNNNDSKSWNPVVKIKAFDKNFTLYLKPNSNVLFGENTPIFIAKKSRTRNGPEYTRKAYSLPKRIQLYHDKKNGAAVTAYADNKNERLHLEGPIGEDYYIHPIPNDIHEKYLGKREEAYMVKSYADRYSIADLPQKTHHVVRKLDHNKWFDPAKQRIQNTEKCPAKSLGAHIRDINSSFVGDDANEDEGTFSIQQHPSFFDSLNDLFPFGRPSFLDDPFFSIDHRNYHDQDPSDAPQDIAESSIPPKRKRKKKFIEARKPSRKPKRKPSNIDWNHDKPSFSDAPQNIDNAMASKKPTRYKPTSKPKPTRRSKGKPYNNKHRDDYGSSGAPRETDGPKHESDEILRTPKPPRRPKPKSKSEIKGGVVYPEILVVLDYATFEAHNKDVEQLSLYMAAFWNAVDLRYRELRDPKVRLSIAGIIIPEEPEAAPYLELHRIGSNSIDSSKTLDSLGEYFSKPGHPCNFDLVIAITHRTLDSPMISKDSSGTEVTNSKGGLAIIEGACQIESRKSVGIIHDKYPFQGIINAAHELGHLLGAGHDKKSEDGYKGGECHWDHGYLMSYIKHNRNAFHWSPCSKQTMKNYINDKGSCLWNKPNPGKPLPKFLPGRLVSRHEQCEIGAGPGYRANETSTVWADCAVLECAKVTTHRMSRSIHTLTEHIRTSFSPAEGTECGEDSICLDGECVLDPEKK